MKGGEEMSINAKLCQNLIRAGRTKGMAEKLSALLSYDQITIEEYDNLMAQLPQTTN